ncbi:MAG: hypothetical protein Q8Q94_01385 [bacterium]|nr:hypothetical protein [bacterium]
MSSAWANASIAEFEKEKMEIAQAESSFAQKARNELVEIETKLDRLLDLQLDGSLSQTEYATKKHKLILAKKDLEEKISAFGRKSNNRFERATRFILQSKEVKILAKDENLQSLRDCFKKVGSNFLIQNRAPSFTPRGAWQILAESTFGALRAPTEAQRAESTSSQNWDLDKMWSNYIICSHLFPEKSQRMNASPLAPLAAKQENTPSIFPKGRAQNQIIGGEYFLAWLCL